MDREYVILKRTRSANIDEELDAENYLSRTVYEDTELIDTGVLDESGEKIMARRKLRIGFVHLK